MEHCPEQDKNMYRNENTNPQFKPTLQYSHEILDTCFYMYNLLVQ